MSLKVITAAALGAFGVEALKAHEGSSMSLRSYSFEDFVSKFGRSYSKGSDEWTKRENIFQANLKDIIAFQDNNARPYNKGVTKFADFTNEEYKRVLGYKGRRTSSAGKASLGQDRAAREELPSEFHVAGATEFDLQGLVRDQGGCGSCWAEAATSVLESHLQVNATVHDRMKEALQNKKGKLDFTTLSSQQVVSCTQNPHHCGGNGGCQGATVELAYDMVKEHGLPLAYDNPYVSGSGSEPECKQDLFAQPKVTITGYVALPSNKVGPLLQALVQTGGAVAVSAAASGWSFYMDGIFKPSGDWTVNHAVTLVGYKLPTNGAEGYFKIKNSWGSYWGEKGHIRVQMLENEDENCGMDHAAHDGLACDGDPDDTWVCGSSGLTYDSVYPTGVGFQATGQ